MGGGFPSPALAVLGMVHALLVRTHREEDRQGAGRSPECSRDRETHTCAVTSSLAFNVPISLPPFFLGLPTVFSTVCYPLHSHIQCGVL